MIDSHSHIYLDDFNTDREQVIERALNAGINKILLPNVDSSTVEAMIRTEDMYPEICLSMMGLHPTSVKGDYLKELSIIEQKLSERSFIAIGEIGMDLYWDTTFIKEQKDSLSKQLLWAMEKDLPVSIHTRNAFSEIFDVIGKVYDSRLKGVFHSFSGTVSDAKRILEMPGLYFGVNGTVTYKNSKLSEIFMETGYEKLLMETDAPYLPPVPHRGKRNEPAFMVNTAKKLAEIFSVKIEDIDKITTENTKKLFKLIDNEE